MAQLPIAPARFCFAIAGVVLLSSAVFAQERSESSKNDDAKDALTRQLAELQHKVANLEAALKQQHAGTSSASKSKMGAMKMKGMSGKGNSGMDGMAGMSQGGGMSGMGMMSGGKMSGMNSAGSGKSGMGGMGMMTGTSGKGKQGMGQMGGGMSGGMGMGMMGRMKGMGQMQMASSLPGFPGASHIYHIGATSFFLDHSEHITLTPEQQTQLNQIKESALLAQSTFDRQIDEAEQQLWVLTAADSPDATAVEARVGEIAKLTADKRIAFIRAVGKAAGVLTDQQRKTLIGFLPPDHTNQTPNAGTDVKQKN